MKRKTADLRFMKYQVNLLAKIILLVMTIVICQGNTFAQEAASEPEVIPATATRCQRNTINIFGLGSSLHREKEKVFVIARLGSGETSRHLNRRRLNDVKTEFGNNWNPERIILAEGERIKGNGRVEFYLGSQLWFVSLIPRNGDICSLCCDRKKVFYETSVTTGKLPDNKGWFMKIGKPANKPSQRKPQSKFPKTR